MKYFIIEDNKEEDSKYAVAMGTLTGVTIPNNEIDKYDTVNYDKEKKEIKRHYLSDYKHIKTRIFTFETDENGVISIKFKEKYSFDFDIRATKGKAYIIINGKEVILIKNKDITEDTKLHLHYTYKSDQYNFKFVVENGGFILNILHNIEYDVFFLANMVGINYNVTILEDEYEEDNTIYANGTDYDALYGYDDEEDEDYDDDNE